MRPLVRLGRRFSRDAGLYSAASGGALAISLVNVGVLTHYLAPSEFGELAVLLVLASFLTIAYNLSILQGALAWVYGTTGEEEVETHEGGEQANDKRRALGTGIVLTAIVAALGTVVVAGLSSPLEQTLDTDRTNVAIAAGSGGLGSLWRLVSNIPRVERRSGTFLLLSLLRPTLVLAVTVPLINAGAGVEGALLGVALGTALSAVVGLVTIRRSFRLAFDVSDVKPLVRLGLPIVPIVLSFWVIQNVDIFVLSRFASEAEVGVYRLASRVGSVLSYFVAAFTMAWGPLARTSLFEAAARNHGRVGVGSRFLTFYILAGVGLLVAITVTADLLVAIAPATYADAAGLVPVLGVGFLVYGGFITLYRASRFPRRRRAYTKVAVGCALGFLVVVVPLTAWLGAYGAALSPPAVFLVGCACLARLSRRGPEPILLEWRKTLIAILLGAVCIAAGRGGASLAGAWGGPVEVALALVLYPLGLVVLGVVPRHQLTELRQIARGLAPAVGTSTRLAEALDGLNGAERETLEAVLRKRSNLDDTAAAIGVPIADVEQQFIRGLAKAAGVEQSASQDREIARLLGDNHSVAEHDNLARQLWNSGVDPDRLDYLERMAASLRSAPSRVWRRPAENRQRV